LRDKKESRAHVLHEAQQILVHPLRCGSLMTMRVRSGKTAV
jgi:hypothetical protein